MLSLKMEVSLLCTIMLSVAVALTYEELEVSLTVSPSQTAECGQPLSLTCRMSTFPPGTEVIDMTWDKPDGQVRLCNQIGNIKEHSSSLGDFSCSYEEGELTLTLTKVKPMNVGEYLCKLQSNQGVAQARTSVVLQECYSGVNASYTKEKGPACTFTGIYPEGEVHWFQGSSRLLGNDATTERVEEEGLTIHSELRGLEPWQGAYNCSLWNPRSGRYMTSELVAIDSNSNKASKQLQGVQVQGVQPVGRAEAAGTYWKLWGFTLLLTHLLMKL